MRFSGKNEKYIWAFVALTGLYAGLYFALPTDPQVLVQYNLSQFGARLLGLTILLPLLVVFYFALYGFLRFKEYATSVNGTKEGSAFGNLANGLMVLAFSLPINSCLSTVINYIEFSNPDLLPAATIIKNYVTLILPFVSFILLARGAEELTKTLKVTPNFRNPSSMFIIILSCSYTWLITTRPSAEGSQAIYFIPEWLVIATLAIPYLYMWTRGIKAKYYLRLYQTSVKGSVYKHSISYLAYGITGIVVLSILLQIFNTLAAQVNRLSLTPLLFVIYALIALYAIGYGFVAKGAKKLKKIEEV